MAEVRRALDGEESADLQAEQVNALLADALPPAESDAAEVVLPARILQGIKERTPLGSVAPLSALPSTPLSQSDLLVNAEGQPNVGTELRRELASADSVDLICAFVIWSGVRHQAAREGLVAGARLGAEHDVRRGGRCVNPGKAASRPQVATRCHPHDHSSTSSGNGSSSPPYKSVTCASQSSRIFWPSVMFLSAV